MDAPALLQALGRETAATAAGLSDVHDLLGELVGGLSPEARGAALVRAQALDLAVQRIEALATVLGGLARGEPAPALLARIGLGELAAALGAGPAADGDRPTGDLELFG